MKGIEVVIFDYGNTLVFDPFEKILNRKIREFQATLKKFGYRIGKKKIFKSWCEANKNINYPHITHFAQEEPIIKEALKNLNVKSSHLPLLAKEFLKIYRKELKNVYKKDTRKKDLKSVLKYLKEKGKILGVISNGRQFDVNNAAKWYGIYGYFDFIITSEKVGVEKPNEKIFKHALSIVKKPPEKVVYVGDNPKKDIESAKKLGMKAILFVPPKKFRKEMPWRKYRIKISVKPDATIRKISQLKEIIE
jgi:HAD superfamily hydrolase (TIGR01549 family)